jgi:ATPase subunit of ABC transporter with duplicated ATPase domains
VSFNLKKGEKVAFISKNPQAVSSLFNILMEFEKPDSGTFKWGVTTSRAHFPHDNTEFFQQNMNLLVWMEQWVKEKDEQTVRSFLGRMLFSGEEPLKKCTVLSGGEKVRLMLSRMMASGANVLLLDQPTNHLDLESIAALGDGVRTFEGTALFTTHDRRFIEECAGRIIELTPKGCIDELITFDDYMANEKIQERRQQLYA